MPANKWKDNTPEVLTLGTFKVLTSANPEVLTLVTLEVLSLGIYIYIYISTAGNVNIYFFIILL